MLKIRRYVAVTGCKLTRYLKQSVHQVLHQLAAPMFVKVCGTQFLIQLVPGEHVEGTDQNGMHHPQNCRIFRRQEAKR
jgi:hypothetical protein